MNVKKSYTSCAKKFSLFLMTTAISSTLSSESPHDYKTLITQFCQIGYEYITLCAQAEKLGFDTRILSKEITLCHEINFSLLTINKLVMAGQLHHINFNYIGDQTEILTQKKESLESRIQAMMYERSKKIAEDIRNLKDPLKLAAQINSIGDDEPSDLNWLLVADTSVSPLD